MWYTWHGLQLGITRYVFAGQFVKDKLVLEIACENGYGASYLLSKGATEVTGGDISEKAIEYARVHYKNEGLHFLLLDAQELQFADNSFDVVVAFEVIEHLGKYEAFLSECKRVLKNNGIFICSTPNKAVCSPNRDKPWFPGHVKEFYIDEFRNVVARYFDEVSIYGICSGAKAPSLSTRIIYGPKPKILQPLRPVGAKMMNFITGFTSRDHRLISLEEINGENLDKKVDVKYQPFLIKDNMAAPENVIVLASLP